MNLGRNDDVHRSYPVLRSERDDEVSCRKKTIVVPLSSMPSSKEIETAVAQLSSEELATFRAWFMHFDATAWDTQFEQDVSVLPPSTVATPPLSRSNQTA